MSAYTAAVLADAPRHYWRCSDPGGAFLFDIGATPKHLALTGAFAQLPYAGPISDGGSIWCGSNAAAWWLDTEAQNTPYSIEAWFWMHYSAGVQQVIAEARDAGGTTGPQLRILANGKINAADRWGQLTSAGVVSTQVWHHAVYTNTNAAAVLYLDNVNVAAGGAAAGGTPQISFAVGIEVPSGASHAEMNVAEVAYYTTALSAARVNAHFTAADQIAALPVFGGLGTYTPVTGVSVLDPTVLAQILASVRKVY